MGRYEATSGRPAHRVVYRGSQVSVRMPSATAVRKFAAAAGPTVDIPVSVVISGEASMRWVRVTSGGDGAYGVAALGDMAGGEATAEAVRSVLEARRPAQSLSGIGDLTARSAERSKREGTELQAARSSWVRALGYEPAGQTMVLRTKDHTYGYVVPAELYDAVVRSGSIGHAFNLAIRGRHRRVEIAQCEACGRCYAAGNEHACPPRASRLSA